MGAGQAGPGVPAGACLTKAGRRLCPVEPRQVRVQAWRGGPHPTWSPGRSCWSNWPRQPTHTVRPQAPLYQLGVCVSRAILSFSLWEMGRTIWLGPLHPAPLVGCGGPEGLGGLPRFPQTFVPLHMSWFASLLSTHGHPSAWPSLVLPKRLLRPAPHPALHHGSSQEAGFLP